MMKTLLLPFFFMGMLDLGAQPKIAVVDIEATQQQWFRVVGFDSLFVAATDSLQSVGKFMLQNLQKKYNEYSNICATPKV